MAFVHQAEVVGKHINATLLKCHLYFLETFRCSHYFLIKLSTLKVKCYILNRNALKNAKQVSMFFAFAMDNRYIRYYYDRVTL